MRLITCINQIDTLNGQLVCMKEYGGRKGGQALHDSMHVGQTVTLDDKADSIYRTEKGNGSGSQTKKN